MTDRDCIRFLQWAVPKFRMRWPGFRKVRSQVCKRIERRMRELGLPDAASYRPFLDNHPDEWQVLDSLCRVTISRFYRDKAVFRFLEQEVLPALARMEIQQGGRELHCWSTGCASGEEPYTLALLWNASLQAWFPDMKISVTASDADPVMIARAKTGCYSPGSLKELPKEWLAAFEESNGKFCIRKETKERMYFALQDIRTEVPDGLFHLVLCRNIAFTYFDEGLQREVLALLRDKLHPGGALVIGIHEKLPQGCAGFTPWPGCPGVYRKERESR